MKIIVANTRDIFINGGAEVLEKELIENLRLQGHEVEQLSIPFNYSSIESIKEQIIFVRSIEISNCDLVIGMRFPAYLVRADRKILWLVHQYRQIYELLGTEFSPYTDSDQSDIEFLRQVDFLGLKEAKKIFTISEEVSLRLAEYSKIESETLNLPIRNFDKSLSKLNRFDRNEYILLLGRIDRMKRQHLFLEALQSCKSGVKLVIAGPSNDNTYLNELRELAINLELTQRVSFEIDFHSREVLNKYIVDSICVGYAPYMEDAYGLVTIEAAQLGKMCISTDDAGEVAKLVSRLNKNFIVRNNNLEISRKMDEVYFARERLKNESENVRKQIVTIIPNWETVLEKLTS